jgi:hypothetical protein
MFRKPNSAAISHPSLLTACQMALAVTSGLSRTCAVNGLVTHYINAHDHRNLRKEATMLRVGVTGTNNNKQQQTTTNNTSKRDLELTQYPVQWVPGFFPRKESGSFVKLTTYAHLVPKLRMNGVTHPLPSYAVMTCKGTNSKAKVTHTLPCVETPDQHIFYSQTWNSHILR